MWVRYDIYVSSFTSAGIWAECTRSDFWVSTVCRRRGSSWGSNSAYHTSRCLVTIICLSDPLKGLFQDRVWDIWLISISYNSYLSVMAFGGHMRGESSTAAALDSPLMWCNDSLVHQRTTTFAGLGLSLRSLQHFSVLAMTFFVTFKLSQLSPSAIHSKVLSKTEPEKYEL